MGNLALEEYTWLVVVGALAAFAFGYATGANDVANAFATSVGSRALTMKQAVILAAIFEFVGAMVLGRVSTSVIAKGIAEVDEFEDSPESYAYGMVIALSTGAIWQLWASYAGYNVSATQSIIGGIIGFALVWGGADAVKWATKDEESFPPYKGVVSIILSWIFAPILTAAASATIFAICRTAVLRRSNALYLSYYILPVAVFVTTWINMYFIFTKGAKKMLDEEAQWTEEKSQWVAAVCAACAAFLTLIIAIPYIKFKVAKFDFSAPTHDDAKVANVEMQQTDKVPEPGYSEVIMDDVQKDKPQWALYLDQTKTALAKGTTYDIHAVVQTDPLVAAIHANAEKFDPAVEKVFSYLQVFSAICVIFAHGAGEVGYMAGPLSQIYFVVRDGEVSTDSFDPLIWVLFISAFSLVFGLATYGYNVMQAMGTMLAKLTPSRGFAAELATGTVIMFAAQYGLPTSSSQCITGGILGVGMLEGVKGVNWVYFLKQLFTWAGTLLIVGGLSAAFFANALYTPSKLCNV